MDELVSIISPCYNGEKYVRAFLDSVLSQTYSSIELILIDDASTDQTSDIVHAYIPHFENRGFSLIYRKQEVNKGQAAAINVGLKLISGAYLTWMDSDDIFYPEAIERKVQFLEDNPELDFVLNWGEIVDESNIDKSIGILKRMKPTGEDALFRDLLDEKNVVFGPGTILAKTSSFQNAVPDMNIFESREGQNWQLMLPLAYSCKYGYLDEILFKYVIHSDSHSHTRRTYKRENERRVNFYALQVNTINKIVGMSEDEKNDWKAYCHNRLLFLKYRNAVSYHQYQDYKNMKQELAGRNIQISLCDRYFIYDVCKMCKKIKRKIRKVLVS